MVAISVISVIPREITRGDGPRLKWWTWGRISPANFTPDLIRFWDLVLLVRFLPESMQAADGAATTASVSEVKREADEDSMLGPQLLESLKFAGSPRRPLKSEKCASARAD